MEKLVQTVKQFWNDESGVTAVEYAIMIAAVGAVIITAGPVLGQALNTYFGTIVTAINNPGGGA